MNYFVQNGNESIVKSDPEFEAFKQGLVLVGVSPWHITCSAEDDFRAVPPELRSVYLPLRKNLTHPKALEKVLSSQRMSR